MKYLYASGDSFVAGMECLGNNDKRHENKYLAFPKTVGTGLGCTEYINNAEHGATNEYIVRKAVTDLQELEKSGVNSRDVFVIIGWTSLFRIELDRGSWLDELPLPRKFLSSELTDNAPFFVNPNSGHWFEYKGKRYNTEDSINPFCVKYLWHHSLQNPQWETKLILLDQYLKSKGYRYLFLNTCGMLDTTIESKHFYKGFRESFYSWGTKYYPEHKMEFNHFDHIVHDAYSKVLLEYIEENNI